MQFRLLGPLEVEEGGRLLPVGGAKQRALVTVLLLHAGEVVSRDRLIEDVWGDREPGTAGHSLDHQISRLRKSLEPAEVIETRPGGYLLHADPGQIDARRFERLLDEGRRARAAGHPADAARVLRDALGLWRGAALADVAYESFARTEAERLEELRVVATEERIESDLALGQDAALVPELEALIAAHPLRERLRGQLMLALYRSGRQADALRVYAETRTLLVEELGLEPGQPLRELEQRILRQDPELERPPTAAGRRRRRAWAVAATVTAAGIVTGAVLFLTGGTQSTRAQAVVQPDSDVLLSASSGKVAGVVPAPSTADVRFGFGSLWSISTDGVLTRADPRTGKAEAPIPLAIQPSSLAVGAGSVWVTDANSRNLYRIDPSLDVPVVIGLPKAGNDQTNDVLIADGSVWVGHGGFNPGTYVDRLDPATGRLERRISVLGGQATALASGDGAIWVASNASGQLWRIDPRTNALGEPVTLKRGVCCIAAGGGYVWVAEKSDGLLWKIAQDGTIVRTLTLPAPITALAYGRDALWVADGDAGTVVRFDPTTDARKSVTLGHVVTSIDAHDGLVAASLVPNADDVTAGLTGRIVRIAQPWAPPTDPSLGPAGFDFVQRQFGYATCGTLLGYRDVEGDAGKRVVPELATAMPTVNDGGRTYTFQVRSGYRFSPPSNEAVTAQSFRRAIERIYSPKLFPHTDLGQVDVIAGSAAYRAGKTAQISGVSAHGNTLTIRLVRAVPEFPRIIATAPFCAVPVSTPVLTHGVPTPIASAGPYYLASQTSAVWVLKPNPHYPGPRPQRVDAIVVRFGVPVAQAAAEVAAGKLDYLIDSDPELGPDTAVARSAGPRYKLTPDSDGSAAYLRFNTSRPLFADPRRRRAVQYALDRKTLAAIDTGQPATRLLSPDLPGFDRTQLYPLRPDPAKARALLGHMRFKAVIAAFESDRESAAFVRAVTQELAAAGIDATVLPLTYKDYRDGNLARKAARSDLIWGSAVVTHGDPVEYLRSVGLPQHENADLTRIATLADPARDIRAAALAAQVDRESLFAVYQDGAIPELVSRRVGCVVNQPEYAGVDLAALCLRTGVH